MGIAARPFGIDMDDGVGQVPDLVKQPVMGRIRDAMSFGEAQCAVDTQADLSRETVSHPAGSHLAHRDDTGGPGNHPSDVVDERRVHCIEESSADATNCLPAHRGDGGSDDETDHGVGPIGAERDTERANDYEKRSDAVRAGVELVGLQCS
jgi:hypothetical protein